MRYKPIAVPEAFPVLNENKKWQREKFRIVSVNSKGNVSQLTEMPVFKQAKLSESPSDSPINKWINLGKQPKMSQSSSVREMAT